MTRNYPQIRIDTMIERAMIVKIVPTAAVELSKKLSDIRLSFLFGQI
jgi:hypothetical protein